jgi:hypothetical protein
MMRYSDHGIARAIVLLAFFLTSASHLFAQSLDPNKPPGGNFNLTNFYLGLPVDSTNGTAGDSASIPAAQLTAGYSNAFYFYTAADGAMVFWAFVTGATTSGSSYPRSELREQVSPPSNSSNWFAFGTHTLDAQCRVQQVPSTSKVIIGQIHGYTGAALPLVKLQYNNGTVEALIKTNANNDLTDYKFIYSNVGLSNAITYQIKVVNGLVLVTVNGTTKSLDVFKSDPDWATNTLYYKAGSYCQDNAGTTNEGARVAFYSITRSHGPAVTNVPFTRSVVLGTNTTFSVNAFGNGPLRYQWLFNLTNSLSRATNASFTLTNIQTTDAGDYYVRVSDAFGSITNQIASLNVQVPPSIVQQPTNQTALVGTSSALVVAAGGTSPLAYQWYLNTNTPVPAATNATLTLTNVQPANAGVYSVVVTNAAGATNSAYALLAVNRPPLPGAVSIVTGQAVPISVPVSTLVHAATDPDGDTLSVPSVATPSANGGTVTLANNLATYSPAPAFAGADSWTYLLSDSRGGAATGTVSVTVVASNAITLNSLSQTLSVDGSFTADFQAVPGLIYSVDRSPDLTGPWQPGFTNIQAATNGILTLADPSPALPQRFYRIHYP